VTTLISFVISDWVLGLALEGQPSRIDADVDPVEVA
jgi:hypothetical protein